MIAQRKLSQLNEAMLTLLARLRFATAQQLKTWLSVEAMSSIRRAAQRLELLGLVEINKELKPFVYRLSRSGCNLMGERYFRNWHSVSAMQQILLRNEVEIELKKEDSAASVATRSQLTQLGLHPAHSEYAFMMPNKRSLFELVVIDDYLMQSNRIIHKWHRAHLKSSQIAEPTSLKSWSQVCDAYRIYTVTDFQYEKHRNYLAQGIEQARFAMSASVHLIEPIWGVIH